MRIGVSLAAAAAALVLLALGGEYLRWRSTVSHANHAARAYISVLSWRQRGKARPPKTLSLNRFGADIKLVRRSTASVMDGRFTLLEVEVVSKWHVLPGGSFAIPFSTTTRALLSNDLGSAAQPFTLL